MQNTTYYNLKKPEGTDFYNIENENDNMDIIDGELKDHADAISELNTNFFFAGNFSGSSDEALMPDVLSAIRTHFSSTVSMGDNPTYTISFMRNGAWTLFGYVHIRENAISMVVYRGATPEVGYHVLQTASGATPSIVRLPTRSEIDALDTKGTIHTQNLSKANVQVRTLTDIGSITLGAGTYLVVSYLVLSAAGTSSYNHHVNGSVSGTRVVRSTEVNGGGSCNVALFNGNQTITVQAYLGSANNVTVSGSIQAVKL